ncbi:hypothetical protein SAY86_019177 [Trapa natans]|uniref:Pentatricopeptide repeat-containing protein n=1 Tax=Trapa natans TaxID=22666 RepID=A0AAN7LHM4_TRANT|nr:hypothetical protein SAY86_019177 [Trapa natans]
MLASRLRITNSPSTSLSLPSPTHAFPRLRTTYTSNIASPSSTPEDAVPLELILNSTAMSLPQVLQDLEVDWTQSLVDKTLKRLWNHAPKAVQFFQALTGLPHYTPSVSSFDHAIDLAARLRDYKTAWGFVAQMRALRLGPTPKTLAIIAERYVSAGKPDRAIQLFLSMHKHGCRQDLTSFNTILDILCKSGRVEMAYNNLFKVFKGRFRADSVSYNIIANGWCLRKRTPRALEVLKDMVERGLTPSSTTYNIMLNGFFKSGQIDEAWKFFLQMKKRKCVIDVVTYTTLVHGLGVAGEIRRARNVFNEMTRKGILPSIATYNALIQVMCKKDSVDNALIVFDDMLREGYVPNITTYNVVIRGLCHSGYMDKAMDFMSRMHQDRCKPNVQTFNVVIRYLCAAGEIEKGLHLFENMGSEGDCFPNLDTYNILINSMFVRKKANDLVVAGKLLIEMIERGFLPRRFTFNRILNGLLLTGNQDFAKEILSMQSKFHFLPRHFKL